MKKNRFLVLVLLAIMCCTNSATHATTRRVLFIGNSYTYVNNMPLILQNIALAKGDTLIYDESDPGGYTFAMHSVYPATITKIFSQQWDVVVLQEQSQLPSFPPAEVDTEVYPYAHRLDSMIHANDTCTQTMFLMTWGHANGDPSNCAFYPVICTYAGAQMRLRESYLQMALNNHAVVAPVGMAWKKVMDSIPSIWLYMSDSSHPSVPGSYLEASVMYGSIFHKRTLGCTYTDGLSTSVATTLQQVADRVVFDSLNQWQQHGHYPYAGFTDALAGTTATFTGHPTVPTGNNWTFGDGGTDTAANPVHHYLSNGTYVVSHTVHTNCFTETLTDTLHIGVTAVSNPVTQNGVIVTQLGNGGVAFSIPLASNFYFMEVYDLNGKMIRKYSLSGGNITDQFVPGFYHYKAYSSDRSTVSLGKLFVY